MGHIDADQAKADLSDVCRVKEKLVVHSQSPPNTDRMCNGTSAARQVTTQLPLSRPRIGQSPLTRVVQLAGKAPGYRVGENVRASGGNRHRPVPDLLKSKKSKVTQSGI